MAAIPGFFRGGPLRRSQILIAVNFDNSITMPRRIQVGKKEKFSAGGGRQRFRQRFWAFLGTDPKNFNLESHAKRSARYFEVHFRLRLR
jgi:hypothetical protein